MIQPSGFSYSKGVKFMIYITQLIYLKPGQEEVFDEFEAIAIPLISKYNGKMLLRIRPADENFIEAGIEHPYEIHLTEVESEADLQNFMQDEERKKFLHLKEASIRSAILYKGERL
jgi:hypothetical protein